MVLALSAWTLCHRELIRFFRQRSRVIGAVVPPIVFWFLIGSGLQNRFVSPVGMSVASGNYLQYFFPGTVTLIVLFTAIFSTISIIDDRKEGFLQAVLVSPSPRASIALGKILGGTLIAMVQATLFVLIAPAVGFSWSVPQLVYTLVVLFLMAFGLTGLGFLLAWRLDSTQGFHAIMNLFLMPMWLLSGALFPLEGAPRWLGVVMRINPLTYGVSALRHAFQTNQGPWILITASAQISIAVLTLFSATMFFLSFWSANKTRV